MKQRLVKLARLPRAAYQYSFETVMNEYKATAIKKRWCENHPTSYWRDGYGKCFEGWKTMTECKEGK